MGRRASLSSVDRGVTRNLCDAPDTWGGTTCLEDVFVWTLGTTHEGLWAEDPAEDRDEDVCAERLLVKGTK